MLKMKHFQRIGELLQGADFVGSLCFGLSRYLCVIHVEHFQSLQFQTCLSTSLTRPKNIFLVQKFKECNKRFNTLSLRIIGAEKRFAASWSREEGTKHNVISQWITSKFPSSQLFHLQVKELTTLETLIQVSSVEQIFLITFMYCFNENFIFK